MAAGATVLIVPGLRDHVEDHWQTLLANRLAKVCTVAPAGRTNLDCDDKVAAIEDAARGIDGPVIIVAHSAGVLMTVHWAMRTLRSVKGALLAAPPDIEQPMPDGYPTIEALQTGGWFPVPSNPLPFNTIVAASRNDPLASFDRVTALAIAWGARVFDLGLAGHLNPASGFGEWPGAMPLIDELDGVASSNGKPLS